MDQRTPDSAVGKNLAHNSDLCSFFEGVGACSDYSDTSSKTSWVVGTAAPCRFPAASWSRAELLANCGDGLLHKHRASFIRPAPQKARKVMPATRVHKQAAVIPRQAVAVKEDDAALVAAAKSGCSHAFEILVRSSQARILGVVMRLTRSREDAEDILQQSLQKAFIHLQQFEGTSSFSTWLTRIAINEALMWLRGKRASREVPIEGASTRDETMLPLEFLDPGPSPEDSYLQREQKRFLCQAINELTPAVRTAIELRELDELSTKETARALGLSIQAVKTRVFHGRGKLRAILTRYLKSGWKNRNQVLGAARKENSITRQPLISGACD